MTVTRLGHDDYCPVCHWHDDPDECQYDCLCDFIADIRDNERRAIAHLLNPEQADRVVSLFPQASTKGAT